MLSISFRSVAAIVSISFLVAGCRNALGPDQPTVENVNGPRVLHLAVYEEDMRLVDEHQLPISRPIRYRIEVDGNVVRDELAQSTTENPATWDVPLSGGLHEVAVHVEGYPTMRFGVLAESRVWTSIHLYWNLFDVNGHPKNELPEWTFEVSNKEIRTF